MTRFWPPVSVIMPAVDEAPHLRKAVQRVLADPYEGELELIIAVGPSADNTLNIANQIAAESLQVKVVVNPTGRTPDGLNLALSHSQHQIVVRVDGHGYLPDGYIRTAVEILEQTGAANVGGRMVPIGHTHFERAVAWAMSSRFGIGGARFHLGGKPGPVESVYLGVFRRQVLEKAGGFDNHFTRAQDWELNHRIRQLGEIVWFDPKLHVEYQPRSSLSALTRQFHNSGRWRREVMRLHPQTASPRYLAPPFVLAVIALGFGATLVGLLTSTTWLLWSAMLPGFYLFVVLVGTASSALVLPLAATLQVPSVLIVMHMSWAAGFLRGVRQATSDVLQASTANRR